MKKIIFTEKDIHNNCIKVASEINEYCLNNKKFDKIITFIRGGFILTQYISYSINCKDILPLKISFYKNGEKQNEFNGDKNNIKQQLKNFVSKKDNILIVDDLIDTGDTFKTLIDIIEEINKEDFDLTYKTAVIYDKKKSINIDFYGNEVGEGWIVFPWDSMEELSYKLENKLN